ncbi:hypothetical protein C8Q76DRAFT_137967 [Earliella scabrosa]|nr:hypothetical protein C8Q76DRAFT_137967 [Earliella scabrosa]
MRERLRACINICAGANASASGSPADQRANQCHLYSSDGEGSMQLRATTIPPSPVRPGSVLEGSGARAGPERAQLRAGRVATPNSNEDDKRAKCQ